MDTVGRLEGRIKSNLPDFVVGFGGGRSVDIAKMTAFRLGKLFLSVPTSASHDGISSPFVSVRGTDKPHSVKTNTPIGVLADTHLMSQAPPRLLAGGCGDLVAKITAVKDWELARDENEEYFGGYAANLAYMSAKIILDESEKLKRKSQFSIRTVVEALISAGVAACIAGSSRPCSGAEHLFSHAVEYVAGPNYGLHGERVGIGKGCRDAGERRRSYKGQADQAGRGARREGACHSAIAPARQVHHTEQGQAGQKISPRACPFCQGNLVYINFFAGSLVDFVYLYDDAPTPRLPILEVTALR
jgi:glycerol dehydrogenase-like iron-containing ADH family enzyme